MARCQWCTAPLSPGGAPCRYCGRRNDVDLRGVHEFTVAAPDSPRTCPACGIPMQTLDLALGGAFLIERCERCLSLFFDPNEVETLLEKSTAAVFQIDHARLDEATRGRGGASSAVRYYPCPACGTAMNRVNFGARSGVIVDQCPRHGMWLEGGELRRLLEWRKAGGQVLDRRRKSERLAEEQKVERRRADAEARTRSEGADAGAGLPAVLLPGSQSAAVATFVRAVLRLFS
jgi:Zn-finger nucleic acid-binding protein